MTDKFRGHYQQLNDAAKQFSGQGDAVKQTIGDLNSKMQQLQGGDWKGDSADKFYAEMGDKVMPALNKLQNAMTEAATITGKIAQITKNAEDSSSKVFVIVVM